MANTEFPRRLRLDKNTPAEISIYEAIQKVEEEGAHPKLTEAINLLSKAKDLVSDFVDAELVQCECGKFVPTENASIDDDGCWTCAQCLGEMQSVTNP